MKSAHAQCSSGGKEDKSWTENENWLDDFWTADGKVVEKKREETARPCVQAVRLPIHRPPVLLKPSKRSVIIDFILRFISISNCINFK